MRDLPVGAVRLRGVSRSFRVIHDRNHTLKETLLRRRRNTFTERWALENVDLDISPGESVGIIGQNGAGKSTMLKLVAQILHPQAGTVEVKGTVASMLELGAGFHPDFTGRENVYMNAAIHGLGEREVDAKFDEILGFSELDEFIDMPVKTYSSGMQMRLAFSVASHVSPDILLLDEVLAVGDEAFQHKCYGRVFDFLRRGGTLLFVSHDPVAIERVCSRVLLIENGHVIMDGPPAQVLGGYHRLLASGASATSPGDKEVSASGAPIVSIEEVQLIGADGPSDRFVTGEPLTIELRVNAAADIETPAFGIAIHAIEGGLIHGTNTRLDEFMLPRLKGRARIRFSIPRLPLHAGRFQVTVAAHSHDESVVYQWLDRCVEFTVFPQASGIGLVDMSGSWSIDAENVSVPVSSDAAIPQ